MSANPSIHEEFFVLLLTMGERMHSVEQELDIGLSPTQALLLRALANRPPMTPTELAGRVRRHKSQVTRALRGLLESGLVQTTANPSDGRSSLIQTAPEVLSRLAPINNAEAALAAQLTEGFSVSEIETLRDALQRMNENLQRN